MPLSEPVKQEESCPKCKAMDIYYQLWESSDGAHEDAKYTCHSCGYVFWIDGTDY